MDGNSTRRSWRGRMSHPEVGFVRPCRRSRKGQGPTWRSGSGREAILEVREAFP